MPLLPRSLFTGLVDDAAVFPPGSAPLDRAVAQHRAFRRSPADDLIGPLLLPVDAIAAAADLAGLADLTDVPAGFPGDLRSSADSTPLDVVVIARPGTDPQAARRAAARAGDDPRLDLRGAEVPWGEDPATWQVPAPKVVVELPRGTEQALALTEIATAIAEAAGDDPAYAAKFRTGATPTWPRPAERELARVIQAAVSMNVPLKLTGGMHRAVRGGGSDGEQHGVLNVLAAFAAARRGRSVAALTGILADTDPAPLIAALGALSEAEAARVRTDFPAFGCCNVGDPITELTDLGVLAAPGAADR